MTSSAARTVFLTFLVTAAATPALAVDPAAVDRCQQDILRSITAVMRGRTAHIGRCLKELNYDACVVTDLHTAVHENELRNHVAGASSSCQAAVASGAAVSDFGPATCTGEWGDCDTAVPAIATLDDLAECLICQQKGYDLEERSVLGLPRTAPTDPDERACTRRLARLVSNTIRKSTIDAAACAKGGTKPFTCPVDATTASRFGHALATFPRNVATCGIDQGRSPGALVNLCGGAETDTAGITSCFTGLAECIACRTGNSALDQSSDCAAFSGFADCDGVF